MMHPGVRKQALDMQRRFEIDQISLYNGIKKVRKGCSVCQACNPDNRNVKGEAQWTPVPDQPMESLAMDVFSMPEVHIGKETFDCVVLCVDRHSGYVVAVPARKKGLLAKEVAVMMILLWLTVVDIPRTTCSDRGPQFTGGWFKAMCSLMGIRHAESVAYLSRSNGRAEVAGRQLFEKLRKIHITNPRQNWFEEIRPALKAHHDTPTPGGLSPHQILFGTDPLGRGLPLLGDGMAMDAKEIFARQEATARDIRQQLEKEHAERQKSAPSSTAQTFRMGDPVWVIRPRPMGTHRTKTWFTPGEVVRRIGENTCRNKVGHGQFQERQESQLRVREPDLRGQHVSLDYAAHEADSDDDTAAPAAHACACSVRAPLFFSFFFVFSKKKKKRKLGGEEEGHNHPWHTRTAHSTHTGEREPSGPGHRTCNTTHRASTPVNRSQLAQDTADATQQTARAHR